MATTTSTDVVAELRRLSETAPQGEFTNPPWGTDFGIGGKLAGMTNPVSDSGGHAIRAFIVAACNHVRTHVLTSPAPAPAAGDEDLRELVPDREAVATAPYRFHKGTPPKPWSEDWFIARLDTGERIVVRALPEEYSFDFTTADDTYFSKSRIAAWMQLPDGSYVDFCPNEEISEALEYMEASGLEIADLSVRARFNLKVQSLKTILAHGSAAPPRPASGAGDAVVVKLKPCPFCGEDGVVMHPNGIASGGASMALPGTAQYAHCDGCGAEGPQSLDSEEDAADAWNSRAALSHDPQAGGSLSANALERVRHVKRGTEYEVLGEAEAQVSHNKLPTVSYNKRPIQDGDLLTIYRDPASGKLWCRFTSEFRDGRFVSIRPAAPGSVEGRRP